MTTALDRVPLTVVTGFLGSGKTTLVNRTLRSGHLRRTLVVVNEFGEIALDHDMVAEAGDGDILVPLPGGCACCAVRQDLVRTLREATWRFARGGQRWFDQVILETTGMADPVPILQALYSDQAIARRYRLDGVITTVDAVNASDTLASQPEARSQVIAADRIIMTKDDLAIASEARKARDLIAELNPGVPITTGSHPEALDPGARYSRGIAKMDGDRNESHHREYADRILNASITFEGSIGRDDLDDWITTLQNVAGPDLLRIKAMLPITGLPGPAIVQSVRHLVTPVDYLDAWPGADRSARIVVIWQRMPAQDVAHLLRGIVPRGAMTAKESLGVASPMLEPYFRT